MITWLVSIFYPNRIKGWRRLGGHEIMQAGDMVKDSQGDSYSPIHADAVGKPVMTLPYWNSFHHVIRVRVRERPDPKGAFEVRNADPRVPTRFCPPEPRKEHSRYILCMCGMAIPARPGVVACTECGESLLARTEVWI